MEPVRDLETVHDNAVQIRRRRGLGRMQQNGAPTLTGIQNLAVVSDVADVLQLGRQVLLHERQEALDFLDVPLRSDFVEDQLRSVFGENLLAFRGDDRIDSSYRLEQLRYSPTLSARLAGKKSLWRRPLPHSCRGDGAACGKRYS